MRPLEPGDRAIEKDGEVPEGLTVAEDDEVRASADRHNREMAERLAELRD